MTNTALSSGAEKAQTIIFISNAHEKFYYEKLNEVRVQDVYHKVLCYCLGISDDTRSYHSTKFRLSAHFVLRESC